ncbi:MAG: MFS transporter, partial [Bacteroidetes bacterium]|nr:MFS transporter [Bacteroidota bacterium]
IGLLAVGVGALQVVLERGETDDWWAANYIIVLSALSALCLTIFVWWELQVQFPVVNLKVLRRATLSVSAIMTFVLGFGLFAAIYVFPLFAQRVLGYSAFQTGLMIMPGVLMGAAISPFLGKMMQRGVRPQYLVILGFGFTALFNFWMSRSNLSSGSPDFIMPLIFRAFGAALLIVPLTALAVSELAPKDIPQGAALNNMMRQMGGSFGIALINTYIAHRAAWNRSSLVSHMTASDFATQERLRLATSRFVAAGATELDASRRALAALESTVVRQTYLMSYMDAFFLLALLNAVCIPLVVTTIRRKKAAAASAGPGGPAAAQPALKIELEAH